ncbi:hypothetical protein [Anaerotignum lactatifermentans]|uniref:hypothetical protein n=1 Tax=Anaerotignum lactatifermentans TaxID=160404 RepID=UPI00260BACB1|nr:hypothetical protein [Anaerotignum lactatifermentans]
MKTGAEYFLDYYKGRFAKGEITEEQLSQMVTAGTISEDEKQYIMKGKEQSGNDPDLVTYYEMTQGILPK